MAPDDTVTYDLPTAEVARLDGRIEGLINRCKGRFDAIQRENMELKAELAAVKRELVHLGSALRKGGIT